MTLAAFHSLNLSMFELAKGYARRGMGAYSEMQERGFAAQAQGVTAIRHRREVGTGYFDAVAMAISAGKSSTEAMAGSAETAQFHGGPARPRNNDTSGAHGREAARPASSKTS